MGTEEQTLTIASGGTTSPKLAIGPFDAGSMQLPAAMDGATPTVAVQASVDGTNFTEVLELAPETNPITFAANAAVKIPADTFVFKFLRLVASAAQTGGARDFKLFLKRRT